MSHELERIMVRLGKPSDLEWLAGNNLVLARESEALELDPDTVRSGVKALLADRSRGFYLLAELGEARLGQLMVTPEWSDWRAGYYWWIQSVFVPVEHRRRGVFRSLFETACTLAAQAGDVHALKLYVDEFNQAAQDSYRRLGMSPSHYRIFEIPLK